MLLVLGRVARLAGLSCRDLRMVSQEEEANLSTPFRVLIDGPWLTTFTRSICVGAELGPLSRKDQDPEPTKC